MFFWFVMVFTLLFMPLGIVISAKWYMKKKPIKINPFFGYRTTRATKNKETWEFANNYCSRKLFKWGLVMLPLIVLPMLFVIGKDEDTIGGLGAVICSLELVPVLAIVALTEKALKDNFDEEGNRKNGKSEE